MAKDPNYINPRISKYPKLVFVLLMFVLLTAMAQFASFSMIQRDVFSYFGAQPEDVSFALMMTYIGILAILPLQFRMLKGFHTRNYLLVSLMLAIILNIGCLSTRDIIVFTILRFFVGGTTAIVAGAMLITIFSILPESKRTVIGVGSFFASILSIGVVIGAPAAWIVDQRDWIDLYYVLIGLQIISIIICFLVYRDRTLPKKIPLYQLDYIGYFFFLCFGILVAYTFIYGPKYYWFENVTLRITSLGALLFLGLFLIHQFTLKRPSVDLRTFKFRRFWFGLTLLVFFFGIKDTINLLYGYAGGILGWSTGDIVLLGMVNVLGIILTTWLAVKMILKKKQNLPKLPLAGFSILLIYHLWVYENLTPDLSFGNLIVPVFLQGLASGLLFAPLIMLCMASLPSFTGMSGIIVCAYGRFIASLNSITGFFTLQEDFNQKYKLGFLEDITPYNQTLSQTNQLYKNLLLSKGIDPQSAGSIVNQLTGRIMGIQSQLLTFRAIFKISAGLTTLAILSLLVFAIINKQKMKRQGLQTAS